MLAATPCMVYRWPLAKLPSAREWVHGFLTAMARAAAATLVSWQMSGQAPCRGLNTSFAGSRVEVVIHVSLLHTGVSVHLSKRLSAAC